MSTTQRRDSAGLIDQLFDNPHRFEFFQAVRLLETWLQAGDEHGDDLVPDRLRFCNSTSLSFPPSEIESLRRRPQPPGEDADPEKCLIELTPRFMGLLGGNGTLPLVYTELIAARERQVRNSSIRSFLDLFSHRATSLFYAGWKKSRLHFQYVRERANPFTQMALAFAGMEQRSLRNRLQAEAGGVHDDCLAYYSGALQRRAVSAEQLQRVLRGYLSVGVRVEQFVGRWYALPPEARWALGACNGVLGRNAVLADRVWQRDLRVRLHLGPLDFKQFCRFLPQSTGALALRELLRTLIGVALEFEINLELEASAVTGVVLDSQRLSMAGCLGWSTYLQSLPSAAHRCDVVYDIEPEVAE